MPFTYTTRDQWGRKHQHLDITALTIAVMASGLGAIVLMNTGLFMTGAKICYRLAGG